MKIEWYQQNMVNFIGHNIVKVLLVFTLVTSLSACVTQQYKDDKTPIIMNDANKEEIAMTRISLGLGYLKMGNTTQAKLNLEKAKRIAPNFSPVYTAFAHYYDTVGEPKQAILAYEKALSIKSDDADTLNNYGVFLCRQGHVEQAEKQLLKAINVPAYLLVSQSYENIALCQLKNNNFTKAEKYLKKSIEHNPNNVSALINMARLQYAKGDYKAAEQLIKRFEKATRRFRPEPLALAFKIYQKLGQQKAAKSYAAMLLKMYPQSYQAKQYLLNGLARSEIDSLATTYKKALASQRTASTSVNKKRVIKLSPKKAIKNTAQLNQTAPQNTTIHTAKQQYTDQPVVTVTQAKNTIVTTAVSTPKKTENTKVLAVEKPLPAASAITATQEVSTSAEKQVEVATPSMENDIAKPQLSHNDDEITVNAHVSADEQLITEPVDKHLVENADANITVDDVAQTATEQKVAEVIDGDLANNETDEPLISDQEIEQMLAADAKISESTSTKTLTEAVSEATTVTTDAEVEIYHSIDELPVHKVRSGENLFKISKKYNIRIRTLRKWNNLTEQSILRIGDTIYLADPNSVVTE